MESGSRPCCGRAYVPIQVGVVFSCIFLDNFLLNCLIPFMSILIKNEYHQSDLAVGLLFASSAIMRLLFNPLFGVAANAIGPLFPLIIGVALVAGSSVMFAVVDSYILLVAARALQGVGSAAFFTAGMTHLAQIFYTDAERGKYMGLSLAGAGLAVLIAPPIGGFLYTIGGKPLPFYIAAVIAILILIFQVFNICIASFNVSTPQYSMKIPTTLHSLAPMADPLVLIVIFSILLGQGAVQMGVALFPLYLHDEFHLTTEMLGLFFLPSTLAYFLATPIVGILGAKFGRVNCIAFGMILVAAVFAVLPYKNVYVGFGVIGGAGLSMAFVDGSAGAVLAEVLDKRHPGMGYGMVFAAADMAFSMSFIVGPLLGSVIQTFYGFPWACYGFAALCVLYTPFLFFLRKYGRGIPAAPVNKKRTSSSLLSSVVSDAEQADEDATDRDPLISPRSINNQRHSASLKLISGARNSSIQS